MTPSLLASALISGVTVGSLYAIIASGFALILSVPRVVNLAHGDLVVLSAYVTFWLWHLFGLSPAVAWPAAVLAGALGAVALQRLAGHVAEPVEVNSIVLTFGVSLLLQALMQGLWSADYRVLAPSGLQAGIAVADQWVGLPRLAVVAVALPAILGFHLFLTRTHVGKTWRAASLSREGAELMGIDVGRAEIGAFALGGALAGLAGTLFALLFVIYPSAGMGPTITALVLGIFVGVGNVGALLAGGMVLGIAESFAVALVGMEWRGVVGLLALLTVLVWRRRGLLPGREY